MVQKKSKNKLLIEVGCEELAWTDLKLFRSRVTEADIKKTLGAKGFRVEEVTFFICSRRLVLLFTGLSINQKQHTIKGPLWGVAFKDDKPTEVAKGLAKKYQIKVEDLFKYKKEGKIFVGIPSKKENSIDQLLQKWLVEFIDKLPVSKSMRWLANQTTGFSRPIRWLLAMENSRVLSLKIKKVVSDKYSYGNRFVGNPRLKIRSVNDYFKQLEKNMVVIDQAQRINTIEAKLKQIKKENQLVPYLDEWPTLIEENSFLVEYPWPVLGEFDSRFLEMPAPFISECLVKHQRLLPLVKDGKITNQYLAVLNQKEENTDLILKGLDKVVRARLEDALFYYKNDLKVGLKSRKSELKEIGYYANLGTIEDKVKRMQAVYNDSKWPEHKKSDVKAALPLLKLDLATEIVNEFGDLQGEAGQLYAKEEGVSDKVAKIIDQHYLPRFTGDKLPDSQEALILTLIDKLDQIVAIVHLEGGATSQDPYGLRRLFFGVFAIIEEMELDSLERIIKRIIKLYKEQDFIKEKANQLAKQIITIQREKVVGWLKLNLIDCDTKVIDAVVWSDDSRFKQLKKRVEKLDKYLGTKSGQELIDAAKRIFNIIKDSDLIDLDSHQQLIFKKESLGVKPRLLKEVAAKDLYELMDELNKREVSYDQFAKLVESVNTFFDQVLVMDKDEKVKENRMKLLAVVLAYVNQVFNIAVYLDLKKQAGMEAGKMV